MYLGIDIGTSSVKAVLIDPDQKVIGTADSSLSVSRPHDNWSEQDPEAWWTATNDAVAALRVAHPDAIAAVTGIGLSGQMHGATLLDDRGRVLRPAILWNDGRSGAECVELEERCPDLHAITGNLAMPGFTAPKLLWVAKHEPEVFARTAMVLLPKDYIRYRMTGGYVAEMSDGAGTLWLDTGKRCWSHEVLDATGLSRAQMPDLVEGSAPSGRITPDVAAAWGITDQPAVAGGGGDNAAGAIGIGAIHPGDAFVSLGTSGVLWVTTSSFAPNPGRGVHAFCHAIPNTWHQMGVILSAASSLSWLRGVLNADSERDMIEAIDTDQLGRNPVTFLPYLSGERTPHNDPDARGAFLGLSHASGAANLTLAVLEGVALAFGDCRQALGEAGTDFEKAAVIGGGSRSRLWTLIIASVLNRPMLRLAEGETGGAFGAARLGMIAATGADPADICTPPAVEETIDPDPDLVDRYAEASARYQALYPALKEARHP